MRQGRDRIRLPRSRGTRNERILGTSDKATVRQCIPLVACEVPFRRADDILYVSLDGQLCRLQELLGPGIVTVTYLRLDHLGQ